MLALKVLLAVVATTFLLHFFLDLSEPDEPLKNPARPASFRSQPFEA